MKHGELSEERERSAEEGPQEQNIQYLLPPESASGVYASFAVVHHGPYTTNILKRVIPVQLEVLHKNPARYQARESIGIGRRYSGKIAAKLLRRGWRRSASRNRHDSFSFPYAI